MKNNKQDLAERNVATGDKEKIDNTKKNYSTNPKSNPIPEKSSNKQIDENDYESIGYGSSYFSGHNVKEDKTASKAKMEDYGATGKRNKKN